RIAEDLKAALSLWPNDKTLPTIMFYNIIDLLQLKGPMEDVYSLLINSFKEQKSISSALDWFSALWKARRLNHPLCCSPISESFIPHLSEQLHQRSSTLFKDASDERYFVEKLSKDEASTFGLAYAHLERSRQEASTGDVDEVHMHNIHLSLLDLIYVYLKMVIFY
ncbi:separase-like, partial [Trifolium medium]|nr:separase-like [Trifolium medium]